MKTEWKFQVFKEAFMLGFSSFWIGLIYLLTFISGLLCAIYGFLNWNKGQDEVTEEDRKWALEEKIIEQELE